MAENDINSNIVLQTRVPKPQGTGFSDVLKGLTDIEGRLNALDGRTITINTRLNADDSILKQLEAQSKQLVTNINSSVQGAVRDLQSQFNKVAGVTERRAKLATTPETSKRSSTTIIEDIAAGRKTILKADSDGNASEETITRDLLEIERQKNIQKGKALALKLEELVITKQLVAEERERLIASGFSTTGQKTRAFAAGTNENGVKEIRLATIETLERTRDGIKETAVLDDRVLDVATSWRKVKSEQDVALENAKRYAKLLDDVDRRQSQRKKSAQDVQAVLQGKGFSEVGREDNIGEIKGVRVLGETVTLSKQLDSIKTQMLEIDTLKGKVVRQWVEENKQAKELEKTKKKQAADDKKLAERNQILDGTRLSAEIDRQINLQNVKDKAGKLLSAGFTEEKRSSTNKFGGGDSNQVRVFKKEIDDAVIAVYRLDTATNSYTVSLEKNSAAIARNEKAAQRLANAAAYQTTVNDSLANGFRELDTRTTNLANGGIDKVTRLLKTTGNALTGFSGELRTVSSASGNFETKMLRNADVIRLVGDNFVSSVAKVALWTAATSAIFGSIAVFKAALTAIKDLEQGTVLLARVGGRLTTPQAGEDQSDRFERQLAAAKELTNEIIRQTRIIGGNAIEGQKAAAIFLRGGQSQTDTLLSTRAALIATKVAELDVVEAAELLQSAQLQFNLSASETLPLLDQLNTLSNRYAVTTQGLLDSISRSGSVFAEQGGRLSELAALTAIIAQTTSRSGAEIGNALKTIESRLATADVQSKILQKTGVAVTDTEGKFKSLTTILQELQGAYTTLSSAEQNELTVAVAGVRQRNSLIAGLNGVAEALVAESQALSERGSATEEAAQRSETLGDAIDRLYGSFISLSQSLGEGGVLPGLKDIVNTLAFAANLTRDLNAATGNLLPTMLAAAAIFKVSTLLLAKLGVVQGTSINFSKLAAAAKKEEAVASNIAAAATASGTAITKADTAATGMSTVAEVGLTGATVAHATAETVETAATTRSTLALRAKAIAAKLAALGLSTATLASIGLTAGVGALIYILGEYQQKQAQANLLRDNSLDTTGQEIDSILRRAQATDITTKAVIQEFAALAKRNDELQRAKEIAAGAKDDGAGRQGKSPSVEVVQAGVAKIESNLGKLLSDAGITGGIKGLDSEEQKAKFAQFINSRRAENERQLEAIDNEIKREEKALEEKLNARNSQDLAVSRADGKVTIGPNAEEAQSAFLEELFGKDGPDLQEGNVEGFKSLSLKAFEDVEKFEQEGRGAITEKLLKAKGFSEESAKEFIARFEEYKAAKKKESEARKEIQAQFAGLAEIDVNDPAGGAAKNFKPQVDNILAADDLFKAFDEEQPIKRDFAKALGISDIDIAKQELADLTAIQKKYLDSLLEVQEASPDLLNSPQFLDAKEKADKATLAISKLSFELKKLRSQEISAGIGRRERTLSDLADFSSEQNLRVSRATRDPNNPASDLTESLESNANKKNRVLSRLNELKAESEALNATVAATPEGQQRDDLQAEAAVKRNLVEEKLLELQEVEADRARDILKLNADITIEKKKQADEAARTLVGLSNEDKLTALAIADDLARNPNKRFSFAEQFLGDSKQVGIGRNLFGDRFDNGIEQDQTGLGALLAKGGFGQSKQLNDAEKELRRQANQGGATLEGLDQGRVLQGVLNFFDTVNKQILEFKGLKDNAGPKGGVAEKDQAAKKTEFNVNVDVGNVGEDLARLTAAFERISRTELQAVYASVTKDIENIYARIRQLPGRNLPGVNPAVGPPDA